MKLTIKNMVCDRCILVVKNIMAQVGYPTATVVMGEVTFHDQQPDNQTIDTIRQAIEPLGFELISNKKQVMIEHIKTALIELSHGNVRLESIKLSDYIALKNSSRTTNHSVIYSQLLKE